MKATPLALLAVAGLLLLLAGCGAASGDSTPGRLKPEDVRPALRTLDYGWTLRRVKGPAGNTASYRGKAHGPHDTRLEFSIALGDPPHPVPVPGAGTAHVVWNEEMGFVFNDDSDIPSKFKTAAQWKEVARMSVEVEETLCRKVTGEPCPI